MVRANTYGMSLPLMVSSWVRYEEWSIVSGTHLIERRQIVNILEVTYCPPMFLAKYALLKQLQRIFCPVNAVFKKKMYWSIQILIWVNLFGYVIVMFLNIFTCIPREAIWNPLVEGRCINPTTALVLSSALNVVCDLVIAAIPIAGVMHLRMSWKRKIGIAIVFTAGFL